MKSENQGQQFYLEKLDAPVFQEQRPYLLLYPLLAPSPDMSLDLSILRLHFFQKSGEMGFSSTTISKGSYSAENQHNQVLATIP